MRIDILLNSTVSAIPKRQHGTHPSPLVTPATSPNRLSSLQRLHVILTVLFGNLMTCPGNFRLREIASLGNPVFMGRDSQKSIRVLRA